MSSIRIEIPAKTDSKWSAWGLTRQPFPESGVSSTVDYTKHLVNGQIAGINSWINDSIANANDQWRPLAMKGSIGVGKTHWLQLISRAVRQYAGNEGVRDRVIVSTHVVTGSGVRSLSLGGLMSEALAGSGIVPSTLHGYRLAPPKDADSSPLAAPLKRIAGASKSDLPELISLFDIWLRRGRLTPAKMTRLNVSDRLESEGEWIRAMAHFCKLAREVAGFIVWVFLLDQLEDLWIRDITTPMRRARFLSDLRLLIDEGYQGAPIAVAMAWNTAVPGQRSHMPQDVENQLRQDYYALFSRIHGGRVVEIPALPREQALEFSEAYANGAAIQGRAASGFRHFRRALTRDIESIVPAGATVTPRDLLGALRAWAEALPSEPT